MNFQDPELAALAPLLKTKPEPLKPAMPHEEAKNHVAFAGIMDSRGAYFDGYVARKLYIPEHGFVYFTKEQVDTLATELKGKRCIEVGAGTGLLSHLLQERGLDVLASDLGGEAMGNYGMRRVWKRDHEGDSLSLLPGSFDAVLLCWPPYQGSFGAQVLSAMRPGQVLFFEGEGAGGCTADDAFFEVLSDTAQWTTLTELTAALNTHHLQFTGIHDRWSVFQKVPT